MSSLAFFTAAAFLASTLLFSLEPLIGKLMLPLLGGSPAVWNTCLLFFQAMLLAGYAYAHYGIRLLGLRTHAQLHVALIAVSLLALPPLPGAVEPPVHGSPVPWLLMVLLRTIGLPFFVLSATAPLVQRWLAASEHPRGRDPYFLYAASNLGSLTGLVLYPFVLEPLLGLRVQALGWSAVYALFGALIAGVALLTRRAIVDAVGTGEVAAADVEPLRAKTVLQWTALAAVPSALLLAVTGYITTDLAPMPLLWLLPLSLYLATFVVAFGARSDVGSHWQRVIRLRQPIVTVAVLAAIFAGLTPVWMILLHLAALTIAAYLAHARLAAERPPPVQLTAFYLWISVGGTLGGVFGVLVAPLLFMPNVEYALLLLLALLLPGRATAAPPLARVMLWALPVLALAAVPAGLLGGRVGALITVVPLLVLMLRGLDAQRLLMAAGLAIALVVIVPVMRHSDGQVDLARERNFFGTLRVRQADGYNRLLHGRTLHGAQSLDPARALIPTTYYSPEGPLGDIFAAHSTRTDRARVGVVGLGVGTTVCYRRDGETWDLFEIDPGVVAIARDHRLFTFMSRCAPDAEVVLGDGRRALALMPNVRYDLLMLDAFSSDAIPAHMLTREAFALYVSRLADGGVLAVHISNRYLELEPVVAANVHNLGLAALVRDDPGEQGGYARASSTWVAIGRTGDALTLLEAVEGWRELRQEAGFRAWTDDHSNLLAVLRFRR
jgi:hypothetical protein